MSQPTYEDLGKACKDFFNKGYHLNIFKLTAKKPRAYLDIDTTITCTHKFEDQTSVCEYENKYQYPQWGITTSAKIDTTNLLSWKVDICDKIARGLKLSVDGQFNLDSAAKLAKVNATYKVDQATMDLGFQGGDESNLLVNGSVVGGYKGFLGGYQFSVDTNDRTMKKNNVAFGYCGNGWNIHANMDNAETISSIVHYRMKNNMEVALNGSYTSGDDSKTRYGLGFKYLANPCTAFKAKIDNTKTVTLGCEMKVTDAACLTLCAECDGSNAGKVGCALEFGQ